MLLSDGVRWSGISFFCLRHSYSNISFSFCQLYFTFCNPTILFAFKAPAIDEPQFRKTGNLIILNFHHKFTYSNKKPITISRNFLHIAMDFFANSDLVQAPFPIKTPRVFVPYTYITQSLK